MGVRIRNVHLQVPGIFILRVLGSDPCPSARTCGSASFVRFLEGATSVAHLAAFTKLLWALAPRPHRVPLSHPVWYQFLRWTHAILRAWKGLRLFADWTPLSDTMSSRVSQTYLCRDPRSRHCLELNCRRCPGRTFGSFPYGESFLHSGVWRGRCRP